MTEAEAEELRNRLRREKPYSVPAEDAIAVYTFILERAREAPYRSMVRYFLQEAAHLALRKGGLERVDEFNVHDPNALPPGTVEFGRARLLRWAINAGDGVVMPWMTYPIPGVTFSHRFQWLPR